MSKLIEKFTHKLWANNPEKQKLLQEALEGKAQAIRTIIKLKDFEIDELPKQFWQPDFISVPASELSASQDPRHQAGDYYCFDLSSAFLISALWQLKIAPKKILDLCASPGGKALFAWRAFQPEILVANELINSRISALISNLKRCQIKPCLVTCMDPSQIAAAQSSCFDLVIVDAPCSGQSMYPLGKQYSSAFHSQSISKNALRQRRIIAEAAKTVAAGGYLSYSTCTFAVEENEKIASWFLKNNTDFEAVLVESYQQYQSEFSELPCYRVFPYDNLGAGGFVAIFKRAAGESEIQNLPVNIDELRIAWKQE